MKAYVKQTNGFTLVELIAAIVLIGVAASLLLTVSGTSLTQSADPLNVLDDNYAVVQAIEKINADYRNRLENDPDTDISIYNTSDLSTVVTGLSPGIASGNLTSFSTPDANRKVTQLTAAGSRYVIITAQKNNSRLVTLVGN